MTIKDQCRNPNGTYNGYKLLMLLHNKMCPDSPVTEEDMRELHRQIVEKKKAQNERNT